jgi:YD repeat-containing protein
MLPSPALADFRDDFPEVLTMSPLGVNLQTGRFRYVDTDYSIGPFVVQSTTGGVGYNLRGSMYWTTKNTGGGGQMTMIKFTMGDTHLGFAVSSVSGTVTYLPWDPGTEGWKLVKSGTSYILTNASGEIYTFIDHPALPAATYLDKNKLLGSKVEANGHRMDYTYDASANLLNIKSNRGYAIVYQNDLPNLKMYTCGFNTSQTYVDASTTCASSSLKTTFNLSYNGTSYQIESVVDVRGGTTSYVRSGGLVTCITLVNSSTCKIQNVYGPQPGESAIMTKPDQVRIQTTATGETYTYEYDMSAYGGDNPAPQPGQIILSYATMYGPKVAFITYENGVAAHIDDSDNGPRDYKFSALKPVEVTFPEGNKLKMSYDTNANLLTRRETAKPNSGLADKVATQTFPYANPYSSPTLCNAADVLCRKPITQVDEKGNQSDFTYDGTHGGTLTETGPAVNGVRPQVRYSYAQRYAWIKNSGSGYSQAATPIWVLTQKSICKTGAASGAGCAIAGDEVVTSYDYGPNSGPNNLELRGVVEDATGLALRTCYAYDATGNKISETKPRAGLGGCS